MKIITISLPCMIILASCAMKKAVITECSQAQARLIAEKRMKKHGKKLEMFNVTENEDDEVYIFDYSFKELKPVTGGGGKIKISKKDCSVTNEIYYQ